MNTEKFNFLLKDFETSFTYRMSFSKLRVGILGGTLAIIGYMFAQMDTLNLNIILQISTILILVVFASIRLISAFNRSLFALFHHARQIEKELKVVGFVTVWTKYLTKNVKDTSSRGFVISTRVLNIIVTCYISACLIEYLIITHSGQSMEQLIIYFAFIIVTVFFVWNEIHIRTKLDPRGHFDRMTTDLESARKKVYEEISLNSIES